MLGILDIQLRRLGKRLEDRDLRLHVSPEARAWLAEQGYDPDFGARPLKRLIQRTVLEPLSNGILAGEYAPGTAIRVERSAEGAETPLRLVTQS